MEAPAGQGLADGEGGREEHDGDSPLPAPQPLTLLPIGVCIPAQVFEDNIDDFVAYNIAVQRCLTREETEYYLRQRPFSGTRRTPPLLNAMVDSSVDLYTKEVYCCRNGCVAFTAGREALTECDICKAQLIRPNGQPVKQASHWSLLPWLRIMLADRATGPGMVSSMKEARQEAAAGPPNHLRDWFDGHVCRTLVAQGYFSSDTSIAVSISTDGFQAWKQRGFEAWKIIATVLNVDRSARVKAVSQLILGITPGPGQPADLEPLLHPIAKS